MTKIKCSKCELEGHPSNVLPIFTFGDGEYEQINDVMYCNCHGMLLEEEK